MVYIEGSAAHHVVQDLFRVESVPLHDVDESFRPEGRLGVNVETPPCVTRLIRRSFSLV